MAGIACSSSESLKERNKYASATPFALVHLRKGEESSDLASITDTVNSYEAGRPHFTLANFNEKFFV